MSRNRTVRNHGAVARGKQLISTRPTERKAVRAVAAIFEDANYTFQEVERGIDIGKDAYVDLPEDIGFGGAMVALQIKGGATCRDGENYRIPDISEKDRTLWAGSSLFVYGMVHDEADGSVHWVDLTTWARNLREGMPKSYCPVPRDNLLSDLTLPNWTAQVQRHLRAQLDPPVLGLMSDDWAKQRAAIGDCFALGRRDPRPLMLLRASLRWLADVDATWPAIQVLSLTTHHPDVMWTEDNWLPDEIRAAVRDTYRWSLDEADLLIGAPAGDMWGRGDLGQCVYELLVCDPDLQALLEQLVEATSDEDVRFQAARILVALADEDGAKVLDRLANTTPGLRNDSMFGELQQLLADHGPAPLY